MNSAKTWIRVAAVLGFLGVALGALGAHALKDQLVANDSLDAWKTAATYQMVHAVAIFAVAACAFHRGVCICFALGVLCFSGSIYGLALTRWSLLGPVTPLGGLLFLAGWAWLALSARES